jgi:hypothetical protein
MRLVNAELANPPEQCGTICRMDKQPQSRAPLIIAIVLLLLPVLYVGSYLALVRPNCRVIHGSITSNDSAVIVEHYRLRGRIYGWVFWPLEQLDRKARPAAWNRLFSHYGDDGYERIGIDFGP